LTLKRGAYYILITFFMAFLIVVALYSTIRFERFNFVILRYAPNISNVEINLFNSIILLIAFTAIYNRSTLNNFRCFFVTIS